MVKNFRELPTYDRIQALVRDKQYLKDRSKCESIKEYTERSKAEKVLCKKYHLVLVLTDAFAKKYSRGQLGDTMMFTDVDPVVSIIPAGKYESSTKTVKVKGKKIKVHTTDPRTYILRKGRFLTLEIDLKAKDKDIERLVRKRISTYKSIVEKGKSHDKKGEYDPWEVWDMHKKQGLALAEIARQKSGRKGNPTYDDILRKYDSKVRRAYDKACQMIERIKK